MRVYYSVTNVYYNIFKGSLRDKKRLQKRFLSLKTPHALPQATRAIFYRRSKIFNFRPPNRSKKLIEQCNKEFVGYLFRIPKLPQAQTSSLKSSNF
mgnify:CR=1 FL=1